MIADLGYAAVLIAFAAAVYAVGAAYYGARRQDPRWVESARNATLVTLPLVALAAVMLVVSLLRSDFSLEYVWRVSSRETPTYLKVTALWGGQAGSLLFWNLLLAVFTAAAMARKWDDQRELMPYAIIVASFTQIFFLGLVAFVENPFARLPAVQADGNGLNPLLRHPGMIIHPPMLYLGFTGFTIPYTFAMAALMAGKLDDGWIRTTRRWTLTAWLFLSLGLILGGRWAYDVLGWGGYWAWDPVENASFMPWLAGTAFLHSVMIQEKRNMFRWWNIVLIVVTYCLVIYGTFIVRSGVITSVHSFAQSAIGPLFFGFIVIMFVFSVYWIIKRYEELSTPNRLESLLSREAAFLLNNFLFLGILFATFWGTNFPILSELFTGQKITVGEPFYEKVNGPQFAVLLLLMGVAPLTMWFRTSAQRLGRMVVWPAVAATVLVVALYLFDVTLWIALVGYWIVTFAAILTLLEFWRGIRARMRSKGEAPWTALSTLIGRNRRRYGGYLIHLGVLVMAFGIISTEVYQQETQIRLNRGDTVSLGSYSLTFNGNTRYTGPDDLLITEASTDVYKNGRYVGSLNPRVELYTRTNQPMTIPDLRPTFTEDFYVLLVNWEGTTEDAATFRLFLNPLINWVWAGGVIFIIGTLTAAWRDPADEKITAAAHARRTAVAGATGD
ncbi:MAG: heme lyase CcmF/NrfE family subunit [Chloroflexi bacterium]|nr:heme lyase CcmF/NrfE family subunit [Chloroflexota bacterium]MCI0578361.1 heme lyase CcmF/NrfE family subunit [Chloroflexota bacterium]MCI0646236.1 heme lyase CcmF/NrfE family subunit [Chloroflexota bacterium]MCI0732144.1 heme lyase CcmF/NrfE family subunit [Chloroflexota bacterium]